MLKAFRILRALLVALSLGIVAHAPAAAQTSGAAITLSPVRTAPGGSATTSYFVFDATPSQDLSDKVRVFNGGTAPGTIRLYAVDGLTSQASGTAFHQHDDPRQGVGAWVSMEQTELTLAPGEEQIVPFSIVIPRDANGGQYVGGLVAEDVAAKPGSGGGAIQVTTTQRTIVAVQVNLPGPRIEQVEVTGVQADGSGGRQLLALGLRNMGTNLVKPSGELVVSDAHGQEVQRLPLKLDTFLPNTAIQYPVAVQKQALGAGQYHARVDLTYGTNGATTYEGDFSITPAQVAQVFPSSAPLAPPPVAAAASTAPAVTITTSPAQWPLFAGGAVLLVLALAGGILLGRRGRAGNAAK